MTEICHVTRQRCTQYQAKTAPTKETFPLPFPAFYSFGPSIHASSLVHSLQLPVRAFPVFNIYSVPLLPAANDARESSPHLGLHLTLASFVAGVSPQNAPDFPSQGNQSFDRVVSEVDFSAQRGGTSTSGSTDRVVSLLESYLTFYPYDTLPLKLGVKLPFTHFERSVLRVLNVALTQLHPNSWTFVRSFKLLCEDVGRAPSLGVFFWFFTLRKANRVGWISLSGRLKRKLFKPFLESYKVFKSRFFKVTRGDAGPNLLMDNSGKPFFPLHWTP
ncbi:hypothetical protein CR513_40750, partial [Mucuna pruriens]